MNERNVGIKNTAAAALSAGGLQISSGGCATPVAVLMLKVALLLGTVLITTRNGKFLEEILDRIFASPEVINGMILPEDVDVDSDDPLTGKCKKPIRVAVGRDDTPDDRMKTAVTVDDAKVTRSSTQSEWKLDEALRQRIKQMSRKY